MTTYVALLRGINVGGNSKVNMKKLKALFESMGFANVSTYINSGNVIFDAKEKSEAKLSERIEKEMRDDLGFKVSVLVVSKARLLAIVKGIPKAWANDDKQRTDVIFLWKEFDAKASLSSFAAVKGVDTLKYVPGAIIWNLNRKLYSKSGVRKFIGTKLYKGSTARNVNTARKLAELIAKAG